MKTMKCLLAGFAVLVVLMIGGLGYVIWTVETFDTQTLPDNHGKVVSTLFLAEPQAEGSLQPLIVTLGGSEGGNVWATARLRVQREKFHSMGFAVLAIGYFGMSGIPTDLDRISLDAINDEISRVIDDAPVDGRCVALIGGSRGAELALLLSSYFPASRATVAIVPGSAVFPALNLAMVTPGFSLHDQPLPFVPVPWSVTPALISGDLRAAFETMMENHDAMERAAIPVERMQGPVLFLSATRDDMWPSAEMAEQMMQRLKAHRFPYVAEHVAIEGDHMSPLDHFDVVEDFLRENVNPESPNGCRAGAAEVAAVALSVRL